VRDLDVICPDAATIIKAAREKAERDFPNYPAPRKCIDAVEAAVKLPFDEGLAFERKAFQSSSRRPSRGHCATPFSPSERPRAFRVWSTRTPTRSIDTIGVIGAGTMGTGIAMNGLAADIPVVLLEMSQEALDKGVATIRRNYEASVGTRQADARAPRAEHGALATDALL
jgi:3-hydroxyacyl-CoA dehydrogenase